MFVTRPAFAAASILCFVALVFPVSAQENPPDAEAFDVDFLLSYYDQDGDHSPVTGGTGTEELQVFSPVVVVTWRVNDDWTLAADLGVDQISSASIGNIDAGVSGASIPDADTRTFGTLRAARRFGSQTLGLVVGAAGEYDYASVSYGLDYAVDLSGGNTTIAAAVRHWDDTVDLYDIDGINRGEADRTTTDAFLTWSQVLGRSTIVSLEVYVSGQDGFLSTPFHEVILDDGSRVAERLPDRRDRKAVGLRLNHSFSPTVVQRFGYRLYDDDWGITAHSIEFETHFRLPGRSERWIYPILRYHTQTAADWFGETGSFTGDEEFLTSDWDLAEISTTKLGLGFTARTRPGEAWFAALEWFEVRATYFDRDDGLQGFTTSFGFGWSF